MKLSMKQYQKKAMRTSPWDGHDKIDNGVLGLIGEAGELVDVYKKWAYQSGVNPKLPDKQMAEELGDILWYLAELADGMNMDLIDIVGTDFAAIDWKTARKPAKKTTLRSMILGTAGRAYLLCRSIGRGDYKAVGTHVRKIMVTAAHIAYRIGWTLEKVAQKNIEKLEIRYPNGFDAKKSMERYEGWERRW